LQAYDLWTHNCNNFTNDFATFLLGKGIPEHITNLPQTVLDSPFGRMMKPMIDESLRKTRQYGTIGLAGDGIGAENMPETSQQEAAAVKAPSTSQELENLLSAAKSGCAIVFFTSQTCRPCRMLYPLYNELAAEAAHKCIFIKVDIGRSQDIGLKYSVRATPTFITFLKGEQENRWSGAAASTLRGNVKLLLEMAWPPHPHESLRLPTFRSSSPKPILYGRVPPLEKLLSKMGPLAKSPAVQGVKDFVVAKSTAGAAEATLPDLDSFSWFLKDAVQQLPPEVMFTVVDLLRVAMADSRFIGYYAEEKDHKTIASLLNFVNKLQNCPYALRLVTLQTACNLFSSPLYVKHILCCDTLTSPIVQLITTSLLGDKNHNVRVAAASLLFNIASANSKIRNEERRESLPEGDQIELAASLLEAISVEAETPEALKGFLLAFGYLIYCMPKDGELADLLKIIDAQNTILEKQKSFPEEPLVLEIGKELLGKVL
jgi:thiol-disulfide isomerase/thioredoxin